MDQDEFKSTFDELMLNWEREISKLEIDKILARKIEPLLTRIEYLEGILRQSPAGQAAENPARTHFERDPVHPNGAGKPVLRGNRSVIPANPYEVDVGRELDLLVHHFVMKQPKEDLSVPAYSTEMSDAKKVLAQLKSSYSTAVISGRTAITGRSWFARFASTSTHGTEVLADSLPLAICRLALLVVEQNERRSTQAAARGA